MKKASWFILGAALILAAALVLFLLPRTPQAAPPEQPTLPAPERDPGADGKGEPVPGTWTADAPDSPFPPGVAPTYPELEEELVDPAETAAQTRDAEDGSEPGGKPGDPNTPGSANPSGDPSKPGASPESDEPAGTESGTVSDPIAEGVTEPSEPAASGGWTGFPILPPDLFP